LIFFTPRSPLQAVNVTGYADLDSGIKSHIENDSGAGLETRPRVQPRTSGAEAANSGESSQLRFARSSRFVTKRRAVMTNEQEIAELKRQLKEQERAIKELKNDVRNIDRALGSIGRLR
jgi:molecular chaperone GrpE (heat shock protein)